MTSSYRLRPSTHLANAVELLLKDTCVDLGESIYRNPKETKGVWEIIRDLEKHHIDIPVRPILELLIEERNNIQHRFGSETEIMANWYMEKMLEFFEAYMSPRFSLSLRDYLEDFVEASTLERVSPNLARADPFAEAKRAARLQPAGAVLTVWIEIEKRMEELRKMIYAAGPSEEAERPIRPPNSQVLRRAARLLPDEPVERLLKEFRELQSVRARVVHGRIELDQSQASDLIDRMAGLLEKLHRLSELVQEPEVSGAADEGGDAGSP